MEMLEIIAIGTVILVLATIVNTITERTGIPRVLLYLLLGVLVGDILGIYKPLTFYTLKGLEIFVEIILLMVLFYGGFSIDVKSLRGILVLGFILATAGAFFTAFSIGFLFWALFPAVPLLIALAVGTMLAPNDPIAVFSTVGITEFDERTETIAKVESGFDDTIVTTVVLMILVPMILSGEANILFAVGYFLWLTGSAIAIGVAVGYLFFLISKYIKSEEINPLITLLAPFVTFIISYYLRSSEYVAAFIAGLTLCRLLLGSKQFSSHYWKSRTTWDVLFKLFEAMAFITLGALVVISEFIEYLPMVLALTMLLLLVRPMEVAIFSAKSDLKLKDKVFLSYIAMKGIDPTILAIALVVLVPGTDYVIQLIFGTILFLTVIQSLILWALFFRKTSISTRP